MIGLVAGMGGGTGSGATPVLAELAKTRGKLVIAFITTPFSFEGGRRLRAADESAAILAKYVDALIVISNQSLFTLANPDTTFKQAFEISNDVIERAIRSLITILSQGSPATIQQATDYLRNFGQVKFGFATGALGDIRKISEEAIEFKLTAAPEGRASKALLMVSTRKALTTFERGRIELIFRQTMAAGAELLLFSSIDDTLPDEVSIAAWMNCPDD